MAALVQRDGDACVWCGHRPWPGDLTAEHLLPRSRGGRTTAENLVLACRGCNRRRRSRPVVAEVRRLQADGAHPRLEALASALERLSASPRRAEAEWARRQRDLLAALGPGSPLGP